MSPAAPPFLKLLLAIAGAKALHTSYQRYARPRRDPSEAPDRREDQWWHVLLLGLAAVLFVLAVALMVHGVLAMPSWAVDSVAVLLAAGVLAVFTAAFALGWRNAAKK